MKKAVKKKKYVWAVTDNGWIHKLYSDVNKALESASKLTKKYGKWDYRNDVEFRVRKVEIK